MYSLLKHSDDYSMASISFWNYYRDEINDDDHDDDASVVKSFKYETKIIEKTEARTAQGGNYDDADLSP